MAAAPAGARIESDAFQRLYPDQYLAKFVEAGLRPDGRALTVARPASIALRAVSTADASALVKVGATTALAGVKCEVMPAPADAPDEGRLTLWVEMPPLCSADTRPGRPSEAAQALTHTLSGLLEGVVDRRQLCIDTGKAAWALYVDVYVLDADGSLHDACLLAVLAALSSLELHAVTVDEAGRVQKLPAAGAAGGEQPAAAARQQQGGEAAPTRRRLQLGCSPVSLTCGQYRGRLLVDPTAEEEPHMEALVTATLDEAGGVLGFYKAGGSAAASQARVHECLEAARQRGAELRAMLAQALEAAGLAAS